VIKYLNYIKRTIRTCLFISVKLAIFAHTVTELDRRVARTDKKKYMTFCLATEERLCSSPLQYSYKEIFLQLTDYAGGSLFQPELGE